MKKYISMILNILLYLVAYGATSIVVSLLFINFASEGLKDFIRSNPGMQAILINIPVILVLMLIFLIKRKSFVQFCNFRQPQGKSIIYLILSGIAMGIISTCAVKIPFVIKIAPNLQNALETITSGTNILTVILGPVILGTLLEEILVRGLIYNELKTAMSKGIAVIIQAVIFGAIFVNIPVGIYVALGALVFGLIYMWQKSLWTPIISHAVSSSCLVLLDKVGGNIVNQYYGILLIIGLAILGFSLYFIKKNGEGIKEIGC